MKTLGLIGGISWVSTADYYRMINESINEKLGGLNFSQCVIYSFNYADIKKNNDADDWDANLKMVSDAGKHLKNAGADAIILCANTMHLIAEKAEREIGLPLIHIATATALAIRKKNIKRIGLLGTRFTMERDFFRSKLAAQGIETLIPAEEDRPFVHDTIFYELGKGILNPETKQRYLRIIQQLVQQGAEGIVLGCTEIPLLIQPEDVTVPVFDTTRIHVEASVDFALG